LDFPKVIDLLAGFFEREKLPFAVIGAFGLHAYVLTRATTDLDFVTDAEAQSRLLSFLAEKGYETLYVSPGYSNHLHPDSGRGRVDVVYVSGETSRRLFAETRPLSIAGRVVPVPRPETLAGMKVHAMRNDPERRHRSSRTSDFSSRYPTWIAKRFGHTSRRPEWESSTKNSKRRPDPLDLARDLPTTPADVAAQRRRNQHYEMSGEDYLRLSPASIPSRPKSFAASAARAATPPSS
jgi:hypothetical protein